MIETISILIHFIYLSLYLIYLKFWINLKKEKIIFLLLLVYFLLPGRFNTLQIYDIYFYKLYIFLFLLPLFLKELILFFENFKKNDYLNYSLILIFIPITYIFLYKNKEIQSLEYNQHFTNYTLDLINSIIFIIYFFNNIKMDLKKLNKYVKNFFNISSIILSVEFIFFLLFKIYDIQFYDKSGAFNSVFFSSFFVTSLFAGIAILFFIYNFISLKKFWTIIFILFLSLIILVNIESRAIILNLTISSLILVFLLLKKNLIIRFSIIFLFLFLAKMVLNFDQCTYFESNIFKLLNNYNIKSKNLCDYESSYYRVGLLQREIDVTFTNLPFGVGPGVGKFYYNNIDTQNYLYPVSALKFKTREVYADILDVHFENTQILPPQPSNLFTDLFMSYGINIILILVFFFKNISSVYGICNKNNLNIYGLCVLFLILNFIFNSTSGLLMLQIVMTLLALSYKIETNVKKI